MHKHSAFPFKDPQADHLHRQVVAKIRHSDYYFRLPHLNGKSWTTICNNASERERLEFVGDALIGAFIAEELYHHTPDGGPGYYTVARAVLTANSTFAHLMHKAGLIRDLSFSVKKAGDALETILAAFYSEQGAKAFQTYARQYFLPLIESVGLAYDSFRIGKAYQRKRKRMALKPTPSPGSKRTKTKKGKSQPKAKKFRTTTLSLTSNLPTRTEPLSTGIRDPVAIIDLTEDRLDSDTEQQSSSNSEINDFRFNLFPTTNSSSKNPNQDSLSLNNSTVIDSCDQIRDLLISISTSSAVVSTQKDSEDLFEIHSSPSLGGHTSGKDAQDDLVTRFKNGFSLGTIHNPIIID